MSIYVTLFDKSGLAIRWIFFVLLFSSIGCDSADSSASVSADAQENSDMTISADGVAADSELIMDASAVDAVTDSGVDVTVPDAGLLTRPSLDSPRGFDIIETSPIAIQAELAYGRNGDLGMAWCGMGQQNLSIWFSLVDVAGEMLTNIVPLSEVIQGVQSEPVICALAEGGFAVAWAVDTQLAGANLQVRYRVLDASGQPTEERSRRIGTDEEGNHWLPSIACLPTGGFAIAGVAAESNETFGVFLARVDGNGDVDKVRVNEDEVDSQLYPAVAAGPDGKILVVWEHHVDSADENGLRGRWYGPAGDALSDEFLLGDGASGLEKPAISIDAKTGHAVVAAHTQAPALTRFFVESGQNRATGEPQVELQSYLAALAPLTGGGFGLMHLNGLGANAQAKLSLDFASGTSEAEYVTGRSQLPPYTPDVATKGSQVAAAWTVRGPERSYHLRLVVFGHE